MGCYVIDGETKIYLSSFIGLIIRIISTIRLMTKTTMVTRRTIRYQFIRRWRTDTNRLVNTTMINTDQKIRHPFDSKNLCALSQNESIVDIC